MLGVFRPLTPNEITSVLTAGVYDDVLDLPDCLMSSCQQAGVYEDVLDLPDYLMSS